MINNNYRYALRWLFERFKHRPTADRASNDWYYFLHIPKSAGTSFRFAVYDRFPQAQIYPNYIEFSVLQRGRYLNFEDFRQRMQALFPPHKIWLFGHFGMEPLTLFAQTPPKTLCFFRNPVERVKSSIVYHAQKGRRYHGMSTDQILDQYLAEEGMVQAVALGYTPGDSDLNVVRTNLDSLDFVGLAEEFDRSVALCNQLFGLDLQVGPRRNQGDYRHLPLTSAQEERIVDGTAIDRGVYEMARERFNLDHERLMAGVG